MTAAQITITRQPDIPREPSILTQPKPSAMLSWAESDLLAGWLGGVLHPGLVRMAVRPSEHASVAACVQHAVGKWGSHASRAEYPVISVSRTPLWARSSTDETPAGSGWLEWHRQPPTCPTVYRELAEALAEAFPDSTLFEFWNEPNHGYANAMTRDVFFNCYAHFSWGVVAGGGRACGIGVSGWDAVRADYSSGPMLQDWIAWCSSHSSQIDAVTWHSFSSKDPARNWYTGAASVRKWLSDAGLAAETLQLVTEYTKMPFSGLPEHDEPAFAGYLASCIHHSRRSGVAGACSYMQDFGGEHLDGDVGMVSRSPMRIKPSGHLEMGWLQQLEGAPALVHHDLHCSASGIWAMGTTGGQIIVHRYQESWEGILERVLADHGATRLDLPAGDPLPYILGQEVVDYGPLAAAMSDARLAVQRAVAMREDPVAVMIAAPAGDYRATWICAGSLDETGAYSRARAAGIPADQSEALAQSVRQPVVDTITLPATLQLGHGTALLLEPIS